MVNQNNEASVYSERGSELDLVAPGQEAEVATVGKGILSTKLGGGYERRNGTSEATPQVSAVAALVRAKNPGLTALQVRGILESTAKDLGAAARDNTFGFGLLQAGAALRKAPSPNQPVVAKTTVYLFADRLEAGAYNPNSPKSGKAIVVLEASSGTMNYGINLSLANVKLEAGTYRVVACVNKGADSQICNTGDLVGVVPDVNYDGVSKNSVNVRLTQQ
jgi:subtilisin family serine protease